MTSESACLACGEPMSGHPSVIAFSDLRTARDCEWVSALVLIERGILADVFKAVGVDPRSLPRDTVRACAVMLWRWNGPIAS